MAAKVARKPRRGRRQRSGEGSFDVLELRRRVGALYGKAMASRQLFAKLIGASPGSVFNWEHGGAPSRAYIPRLRSLERQLESGSLSPGQSLESDDAEVEIPAAPRSAAVRFGSPRGEAPVAYANAVKVDVGPRDARLRFALQLAGDGQGRAVSDIVVPRDVLEDLAKQLKRGR